MFLPLSAAWRERQSFLPISSLFSTDTFLICCRQEQFEAGDSRTLLFNALCLRRMTGSFQTLEMYERTVTHSPPGKAKTYISIGSQKCWWVSEAWQAASEAGFPCSIFYLCLTWNGQTGERGSWRAQLSKLQACLCLSEIQGSGGENLSCSCKRLNADWFETSGTTELQTSERSIAES